MVLYVLCLICYNCVKWTTICIGSPHPKMHFPKAISSYSFCVRVTWSTNRFVIFCADVSVLVVRGVVAWDNIEVADALLVPVILALLVAGNRVVVDIVDSLRGCDTALKSATMSCRLCKNDSSSSTIISQSTAGGWNAWNILIIYRSAINLLDLCLPERLQPFFNGIF